MKVVKENPLIFGDLESFCVILHKNQYFSRILFNRVKFKIFIELVPY